MDIMLLWILFSAVCGGIAAARGRSFWSLFLLSLILSPLLGLIAALACKSGGRLQADAARRGHSATEMPCQFCAELIRREAVMCPHCRSVLPAAPPVGSAARDFGRAAAKILKSANQ